MNPIQAAPYRVCRVLALLSLIWVQFLPHAGTCQTKDTVVRDYFIRYLRTVDSLESIVYQLDLTGDTRSAAWHYILLMKKAEEALQVPEMLSYAIHAIKLYREAQDTRGEAWASFKVGYVLRNHLGDNESALIYHEEYLRLSTINGDSLNIARACQNTANILRDRGDFAKAEARYRKALAFAEGLNRSPHVATDSVLDDNSRDRLADIQFDIGKFYAKQEKFERALHHYGQVEAIAINQSVVSRSWMEMARIYDALGKSEESIRAGLKAKAVAENAGSNQRLLEAEELLAELYSTAGDTVRARAHATSSEVLRGERKLSDYGKELAKAQARLDKERRANELAALEAEKRDAEFRRNAYGFSIILLIVIALLAYTQMRLRYRRDKQLLEKEKEVDHMKAEFFADVSHELRSPLTLILGPLQELKENVQDEKSRKSISTIRNNANKLLTMVNRLLDLHRVESGQMKLQVCKLDLGNFIETLALNFESLALQRKIDFTVAVPPGKIEIYADPVMLDEIITNLVSNAFKFTAEGGWVKIKLATATKALSGASEGAIQIEVCDSGVGVDARHLEYIFNRFYQAGDRHNGVQAGSGLGLAMVKELTELHHGIVDVESEAGVGSTFTIRLPLGRKHFHAKQFGQSDAANVPRPVRPETEAAPLAVEENGNGEAPSILIVDDHPELREFIGGILPDRYRRLYATNGAEGLALAEKHVPDLVISDVMMPVMDGFTLCSRLKTGIVTSHIPVILLTAKADKESKLHGLESEADDYLPKPFDIQELLLKVRNTIDARQKLHERFRQGVEFKPEAVAVTSYDQRFLQKVKAVIEANLGNELLDMEILAAEVGMSRSQIHRKMKALTGHAVTHIIRSMRLGRAKDLLHGLSGSVSEIAYQVGFSSPTAFIRAYKDHFGVSPGEEMKMVSNRA